MLQVHNHRTLAAVVLTAVFVALVPACGGSSSGSNGGLGQPHSLSLVNFLQSGVDNLPLNTVLQFEFSEPLDPRTVNSGTIQIRRGPEYGQTAAGEFVVSGNVVQFYPKLPSVCDLADAGLAAGRGYRVSVVGYPEEFCIKNLSGQPLNQTSTYEFLTLPDTDPGVLQDQIPAAPPAIVSTSPLNDEAAVTVESGNEVTVEFTENLDPCTITTETVRVHVYELGDRETFNAAPNGNMTGFDPATKQGSSPYSWGSTNAVTTISPPQVVPSNILLDQSFDSTVLRIRPKFGQYPENALVVVELTFGIRDFGGLPLSNTAISFTTENLPTQTSRTSSTSIAARSRSTTS